VLWKSHRNADTSAAAVVVAVGNNEYSNPVGSKIRRSHRTYPV